MDRVQLAIETASQALNKLQEAVAILDATEMERDASIQRFEFTYESVWKAARHYLRDVEGVDVGSPKAAIRACREVGLFSPDETVQCLEMADDRNLTSHTYDRQLAVQIHTRLRGHADLLQHWLEAMAARMPS